VSLNGRGRAVDPVTAAGRFATIAVAAPPPRSIAARRGPLRAAVKGQQESPLVASRAAVEVSCWARRRSSTTTSVEVLAALGLRPIAKPGGDDHFAHGNMRNWRIVLLRTLQV